MPDAKEKHQEQPALLPGRVKSGKRVVVVGGGIAGLTAAHELVERGYEVEVVEHTMQPSTPTAPKDHIDWEPLIGGMARTQWAAAPVPPERRTTGPIVEVPRMTQLFPVRMPAPVTLRPSGEKAWRLPVAVARAFGRAARQHAWGVIAIHVKAAALKECKRLGKVLVDLCEHDDKALSMVWTDIELPGKDDAYDAAAALEEVTRRLARLRKQKYPDADLAAAMNLVINGTADGAADETPSPQDQAKPPAKAKKKVEQNQAKQVKKAQQAQAAPVAAPPFSPETALAIALLWPAFPDPRRRPEITVEHDEELGTQGREIIVSVLHDQVPAEHGFRFFPSFYLHLFDTLKRIPVQRKHPQSRIPFQEGYRHDSEHNVFENLVPAEQFRYGLYPTTDEETPGDRSYAVPRRPPHSVEEFRAILSDLFAKAGYEPEHVARFGRRMLQYATSCEERRRELESKAFDEFIAEVPPGNLRKYSEAAAQALVAMSGKDNDARTIAYVGFQLILDHLRARPFVDGVLNGPTSEAWFWHWQEYLESQGVVFTAGALAGFECWLDPATDRKDERGHEVVEPVVMQRVGSVDEDEPWNAEQWRRVSPGEFTVIAIPVDRIASVMTDANVAHLRRVVPRAIDRRRLIELSGIWCDEFHAANVDKSTSNDIKKALSFPREDHVVDNDKLARDLVDDPDRGNWPFRSMIGIQFYFEADVSFGRDHTICSDSAWGVTYVSQAQFWRQKQRQYDGYRGVISAIITRVGEAADVKGRMVRAVDCDAATIARVVWDEIVKTLTHEERIGITDPLYFYIDENVSFGIPKGETNVRMVENRLAYLVNTVRLADSSESLWSRRPGYRRAEDGDYEYQVQVGHVVLAGHFVRTHTRLTTMESANESGRRATNAILDFDERQVQRCRTFRLEDCLEWDDLKPLRRIDERLHARGGKHMLDSIAAEWFYRAAPWDLLRLGRVETRR
jgi:hypothetical protein